MRFMMEAVAKARERQAKSIIEKIEKRNMCGYYCATKKECADLVLSMIGEGKSVTWGGSMSLKECKIPEKLLERGDCQVIDRAEYGDNMQEYYLKAFTADYYLMGTNAITLDGELMNIDGNGNRVASLIFGPEKVIVLAGMNKVVADRDEAYSRVRNMASPPNTIRLGKNTPCASFGKCGDCMSPDCICNQIVITRRSREKERIHVILVGEEIGF